MYTYTTMVRVALNVDRVHMAMAAAVDIIENGWIAKLTVWMCIAVMMLGLYMMNKSIPLGILVALGGQLLVIVGMFILAIETMCLLVIIKCIIPM